jgi:predicted PP-loop superfamily ATPase
MTSSKDFFNKIDLSKLDTATSSQIREEILTLTDTDWELIDSDEEMQKQIELIRERLESQFPNSLGDKIEIKKADSDKVDSSKDELESEKAKIVSDIEEMQMLIELTQDTLKENPNDEDLPMYLELLNDTLQGILENQKILLNK